MLSDEQTRKIVADIKAAVEELAANGRVVIIEQVTINVARGGGARAGGHYQPEVEVRGRGGKRC